MIAELTQPVTPQLVPVCRVDDVPLGLGRAFLLGGRNVAVFRLRNGGVAAVENRCPHKGGPLSEGMVAGNQVVCPMHAFRFDLTTGRCDQGETCPIETYPVEVKAGLIHVRLG